MPKARRDSQYSARCRLRMLGMNCCLSGLRCRVPDTRMAGVRECIFDEYIEIFSVNEWIFDTFSAGQTNLLSQVESTEPNRQVLRVPENVASRFRESRACHRNRCTTAVHSVLRSDQN